jgi:hypothetical protein
LLSALHIAFLPIVAATFGVGALTALTAYIEWVGIITMILSIAFFGFYFFRKRQAPACDIDCASKDKKEL